MALPDCAPGEIVDHGPVTTNVGPQVTILGRTRRLQVLDPRIVGLHNAGGQQLRLHLRDDRPQEVGTAADPVAHRDPAELDVRTAVDGLLAIQGQVVGVLRDGDRRQHVAAGLALVDRRGRQRRPDHRVLALAAGVLVSDPAPDVEASRHDAQLLADLFAGRLHRRTAARTVQALGVQVDLFAIEVLRQWRPTRVRAALLLGDRRFLEVRRLQVGVRHGGFAVRSRVIEEELQLIGRHLLARAAVKGALHGGQLLGQDVVLALQQLVLQDQARVEELLLRELLPDVAFGVVGCHD